MKFLSTLLVTVALFTNVFAGGTSVFSALWSTHEMGSMMDMEYCVLHCLSATVDAEQLELIGAPYDFIGAILVAFAAFAFVGAIKRQVFAGSLFIRPDPRLCRLVALRE